MPIKLSVASASFYSRPFNEALRIIKRAGFENIELDMYWKGGDNWYVAQHLKRMKPKEIVKRVEDVGLLIESIHDASGVIESTWKSAIAEQLDEYLEILPESCKAIVLHAPHKKSNCGDNWWGKYRIEYMNELIKLQNYQKTVCIENMPFIDGYYVSLIDPKAMYEFCKITKCFINMDIVHTAQANIDPIKAVKVYNDKI
jgi:sugar phosphate isomerase/epimerase